MEKKSVWGIFLAAVLGLVLLPKAVLANEGLVLMRGAGVSGACFATSVFVDGTYRVLATCRELKMALSPEQNRYVMWLTQEDGKQRRLGEIENGKLATATDVKFTELFVTAESDGYGNKPSENLLLSGKVQAIDFGAGVAADAEVVTATPTVTIKKETKVTPTAEPTGGNVVATQEKSSGVSGALSTVFKIALFGFGALLLIVGVFSFISRRRSL